MTLTVFTFSLTDLDSGRSLGQAVICLDARYIAIQWQGAERLDRRYARLAEWAEIKAQLGLGLTPGPLDRHSAIAGFLTHDTSAVVQYVSQEPIRIERPEDAVNKLDARLRNVVAA